MNKVDVKLSDTHPDKFRLILNITDEHSVGTILNKGELKFLLNNIKDVLEEFETK